MIFAPQKALAAALSTLERVAPARHTNVALTHARLSYTGQALRLEASAGDSFMRLDVSAQPGKDPAFPTLTVPVHVLGTVVRSMSGPDVILELIGSVLHVKSGPARATIATGDHDAFPQLTMPAGDPVRLEPRELHKALSAVRYAAATQPFQAMFQGLKLEFRADRFRIVASDGYRMAWHDAPARGEEGEVVIPARQADEVLRLVKDAQYVEMIRHQGDMAFVTDRGALALRIMAGDYPTYERVVPKLELITLTLSAGQLREAIARVSVFADRNDNNRVTLRIDGDSLHLSCAGPLGTAADTLTVTRAGDEQLELDFNGRFLGETLAQLDGEVQLIFSGRYSPLKVVQPGEGSMHVVVTLRENQA